MHKKLLGNSSGERGVRMCESVLRKAASFTCCAMSQPSRTQQRSGFIRAWVLGGLSTDRAHARPASLLRFLCSFMEENLSLIHRRVETAKICCLYAWVTPSHHSGHALLGQRDGAKHQPHPFLLSRGRTCSVRGETALQTGAEQRFPCGP